MAGALRAFLNRPDHLARAAAELGRWDDAVRLAANAAIDPDITVVHVEATGNEPAALLTDFSSARKTSNAIRGIVAGVRANR